VELGVIPDVPAREISSPYCARYNPARWKRNSLQPASLIIATGYPSDRVMHRVGDLVLRGDYELLMKTQAFEGLERVQPARYNLNVVVGVLLLAGGAEMGVRITGCGSAASRRYIARPSHLTGSAILLSIADNYFSDDIWFSASCYATAFVECIDLTAEELHAVLTMLGELGVEFSVCGRSKLSRNDTRVNAVMGLRSSGGGCIVAVMDNREEYRFIACGTDEYCYPSIDLSRTVAIGARELGSIISGPDWPRQLAEYANL